jgi:hypothetical protein
VDVGQGELGVRRDLLQEGDGLLDGGHPFGVIAAPPQVPGQLPQGPAFG